jgi:effector-binding domain-containing protein
MMLTLPEIVERPAQAYVAVRARVAMVDMVPAIDRSFATLHGWLGAKGIDPSGAAFFKYNLIDMAGLLEIEFAAPVEVPVAVGPDDVVLAGTLPAGRYAQVTWTGPYDALVDVNAVLIGWGKEKRIAWDMVATPEGDRFASRVEIYENNPMEVEDAKDLVTTVAIKLAD